MSDEIKSKILRIDEIERVLVDLRNRSITDVNARKNLMVFRLSVFCGLRRSEIMQVKVGDCEGLMETRPILRVRRRTTKGKRRGRKVPLWWDAGTLSDVRAWVHGRYPEEPFIYAGNRDLGTMCWITDGGSINRRWRTCLRPLSAERKRQLASHSGRHTFISLSIYRGRSLASVRDAVGHADIGMTSLYTHVYDDDDNFPDLLKETRRW